jgi:hypothetical protein
MIFDACFPGMRCDGDGAVAPRRTPKSLDALELGSGSVRLGVSPFFI